MTEAADRLVAMEIKGLVIDPASNQPIVILRDAERRLFLPIWIGVFEASAIQLEIDQVERPRPMTHDLLRDTIEHLGHRLVRVVISDLREHTFIAELHLLSAGGNTVVVDSRPSDALALALRTRAEVFVARDVLERAKAFELPAGGADADVAPEDQDRLRKYLEELGPDELGKYTM